MFSKHTSTSISLVPRKVSDKVGASVRGFVGRLTMERKASQASLGSVNSVQEKERVDFDPFGKDGVSVEGGVEGTRVLESWFAFEEEEGVCPEVQRIDVFAAAGRMGEGVAGHGEASRLSTRRVGQMRREEERVWWA